MALLAKTQYGFGWQWRPRTIVLAATAVILIWLVVSRSLAAYLAEAAPQSALWLNARQPEALLNLADLSINSSDYAARFAAVAADQAAPDSGDSSDTATGAADGSTPGARNLDQSFASIDQNPNIDLAQIRAQVESAVMREPLNARGMRILGQLADISKDDDDASKFMATAARLSLHESPAVYWLMRKTAEANNYNQAISYADALMRTDPEFGTYAVPVLAHFAEQKASKDAVTTLLESNPPWRAVFFGALPYNVTDARTPLDLLLALRTTPTPPTADDIRGYLSFLIQRKFYELAYYTWLQFLPPDELQNVSLLFNGGFDLAPSGLPFDWVITQGPGVTIDIVPRRDKKDEHALLVDFLFGRVDYHSVNEMVLLTPGTYQFNGQYNGKIVGPRGLKWRLVCVGEAKTRIGESPMISGGTSAWKDFQFTFAVPPADCRAQYVQLDLDARMASEELVSGSMLFDGLRILRLTGSQDGQQTSK
jgi:hypothetical protein